MSRSHRRFPRSYQVGPASTNCWKRSYNRTIRRVNRYRLHLWWDDQDLSFTDKTKQANPWASPRDGTEFYWPAPHLNTLRGPQGTQVVSWLVHYRETWMK